MFGGGKGASSAKDHTNSKGEFNSGTKMDHGWASLKGKGPDGELTQRMKETQCNRCGNYGHIAPLCPSAVCNHCNEKGHISTYCYHRFGGDVLRSKNECYMWSKSGKCKHGETCVYLQRVV